MNNLKYLRGLKTMLSNCFNYQKDIEDFITLYETNSDKDGCIKQSYFDNLSLKKVFS